MYSRMTAKEVVTPLVEAWMIEDGNPTRKLDLGQVQPDETKDITIRFKAVGSSVRDLQIKKLEGASQWFDLTMNGKSLKDNDISVRNKEGGTEIQRDNWSEDVRMRMKIGEGEAGFYQLDLQLAYRSP